MRTPLLTVFTPTYNRAHTLKRTYNSLIRQTCKDFEWLIVDDGSTDNTRSLIESWIEENNLRIRYIYKENGGLFTGYNTAYLNINTELNVCIDSDDFMPDNAVELIATLWKNKGSKKYAGITGLDFTLDGNPIGGFFPNDLKEGHLIDLKLNKIHFGDTKQVMRTDLMKKVAPMSGFPGEKNFNPAYMTLQIDDEYPSLFLNKNLCFVEYQQNDSMSAGIYRQYLNSPKSFAKTRLLYLSLKRRKTLDVIKNCIHYNSSCIISNDSKWLKNSPFKVLTFITRPLGHLLTYYIKFKAPKI